MSPTTEIIIFETSEAFRRHPELLYPAFDIALKAEGARVPAYYGKQIEEPGNTGYIFLDWDSYEFKHKARMNGEFYQSLMQALSPCLGGKSDMYDVQFSDSTTLALEGPVTEIAIWSLRAPESRAAAVDALFAIFERTKDALVYGQTREDENKYITIGGLQAIEEHEETMNRPEAAAALEKLKSLANLDQLFHTKLTRYPLS